MPTASEVQASHLGETINFLLDELLGLDRDNKLVQVIATPAVMKKDGQNFITIEFTFTPGSWAHEVIKLLPIPIDPNDLDGTAVFKLQEVIKSQLDPQIADFVSRRTEGMEGVERGVAVAAANALQYLLSSQILQPLSGYLAEGLIKFELPRHDDIVSIFSTALDGLGTEYFTLFVPEIAKTYAKLGLSEILTTATSDSSPEWAQAVRDIGDGILNPIIDNMVSRYFWDGSAAATPKIFDNIKFAEVTGQIFADLLIDFEALDKELFDDLLGLDGDNKVEQWVEDLLSKELKGFIEDRFVDAINFLAGEYKVSDLQAWFDKFDGSINIQELLGNFFISFAGSELAQLFIEIDSLPEGLASNLGSWLGSNLMGDAIGGLTLDAIAGLFGKATTTAIGGAIFDGLGALLGAGIGAIAGSVVFELIDDIFDGAISDLFEDLLSWIRNDSPQAYYQSRFDLQLNEFAWSGYAYSKDGSDELRLAVKSTMEAFQTEINTIINFIGEPASFDQYFDDIFFVWGQKHYNESFATFIGSTETMRVSINRSAEHVVKETVGLVLSHMNFHNGNPIIAEAYDQWKADMAGNPALAWFETEALLGLQNLIGLARFAIDYRQDPTFYDALMTGDAPVAVTLLTQFMEAQARGFNDATTLEGRLLGFEEIGSAQAGDTLILNGPAWRAVARGGNDTIVVGLAPTQEVDGGSGKDTLVLAKDRAAYRFELTDRLGREAVLSDVSGVRIEVASVELFEFNGLVLTFDQLFPNRPPVIRSNGGGDTAAISVAENRLAVTTVAAIDSTDDARIYSIVGGADAALFHIDATTGALQFRFAPDWDTPRDVDHDNFYRVTVAASDGLVSDRQAIVVQVRPVVDGEWIKGTPADDVIDAARAPDGQSKASFRDDAVDGGAGNDLISAGAGADRLRGGGGNDSLSGGDGDDLLDGGAGADTLRGGKGIDVASYALAPAGVSIHLGLASPQVTGGAGRDRLLEIENLVGSLFPDALTGDSGGNWLQGGGGADRLTGNAGHDSLWGGADDDLIEGGEGDDTLDGGSGSDTADYADAARRVEIDLRKLEEQDTLGAGVDTLISFENAIGSRLGDRLTGNAAANQLTGGGGGDVLAGGVGSDHLIGGSGDDSLRGQDGHDLIEGGAGNDRIEGGAGQDTVTYARAFERIEVDLRRLGGQDTRGAGIDILDNIENAIGSPYDDRLIGNMGPNQLTGGRGADMLVGGASGDVFRYLELSDSTAAAADLIFDFGRDDLIDISAIDADAANPGNQAFHLGATPGRVGDVLLAFDVVRNRTAVLLFVDSDGTADATIWLAGDKTDLTAVDFVL